MLGVPRATVYRKRNPRQQTGDAVRASFPICPWHLRELPWGNGNDYDHPHNAVLERLAAQSIIVLRTDELGTIVFSSDGHTLQLEYQGLVEIGTEQVELALGMEGVSSRLAA